MKCNPTRKRFLSSLLLSASFALFPSLALASYQPGQTLDPACPPSDGTCVVVPSTGQWTTSGSNIYFNTGNVGIGTTSPFAALSVTGNLLLTGSAMATAPASADSSNTLVNSQWVRQFFPGLTTNSWLGTPGLSFTDCTTQATCGWTLRQNITDPSQDTFTTFGSIRTETYSGGGYPDHGVNGNFYTTTSPYGGSWDRVLQAILHNTTLATVNAQNVALSGYAYRQEQTGTTTSYEPGDTWGGWFVCDDTTGLPNPTRNCTASENDVYVAPGGGADPNGQRVGVLISAGASSNDQSVHIGYGLKIQAVASSTIDNGIYFGNCSNCSGGGGIPRGFYGNYISDALGHVQLTSDGSLSLTSATTTPGLILSETSSYGSTTLELNKLGSGQANTIYGDTGSNARWGVQLGDSSVESGSNVGSNFEITRYADSGSVLGVPFVVMRSSGNVGIGTTTPDAALTIQSNTATVLDLNSGGSQFLTFGRVAGTNTGTINSPTAFLALQTGGAGRNVNVGTTTPYSKLEVWGSDSASSTSAFGVVNNASTTVFAVFDGGNAQLSGTLTQSSDARLKTNIQSLDASTSLAAINSLTPVAYDWIDPNKDGVRQYGFIAQQVQQVFPNLVSTTSATALTPDGTLGLNYLGLIAPLVEAVQTLSAEVQSLAITVAGFAHSFSSDNITVNNRLCIGDGSNDANPLCVTKSQLAALLSGQPAANGDPQIQVSAPIPPTISGTTTPPSINIQGNNPATINVGDTYTDLGAIAHDNQGHDLSYRTFVNGALSGNILIDTSQVATDTIEYVATDTWGNTATSVRMVVIESASSQ
jgi:hypothetical protein